MEHGCLGALGPAHHPTGSSMWVHGLGVGGVRGRAVRHATPCGCCSVAAPVTRVARPGIEGRPGRNPRAGRRQARGEPRMGSRRELSPTLSVRVRVSSLRRHAGPRIWRSNATQGPRRSASTLRIFVATGEPSPTLSVRVAVRSPGARPGGLRCAAPRLVRARRAACLEPPRRARARTPRDMAGTTSSTSPRCARPG
jgi:hypothetical protein